MTVNLCISKWIVNPVIGLLIAMGTNNVLYTYAALLLAAICIVFCNEHDSLCVLFFCMSFAFVFKGPSGGTSFFTMLTLLYVLWNMLKMRSNHAVLGGIILLVEYVTVVHLGNGMMQVTQLLKFSANYLLLYVAVQHVNPDQPRDLFLTYVFGVLFSSFLKLSGAFPNIPLYTEEDVGLGRFSGMHQDPNYYGVNLIMSLCLVVILYHRKELPSWFAMILTGVLVWLCSQTASKMVFLMLVFPVFLFVYSNSMNHRWGVQLVFVGLVAAVCIAVLQGKIDAFNAVLRRFEIADDVGSLTTGRSVKWQDYLSYIFGSVRVTLLGEGLNAPYYLASNGVPHNTYIDFLYHLGFIGTLGLAGVVKHTFGMMSRPIRRNLMNGAVAVCILIMWFSLSELLYFDFPFHIMLAYIVWNTTMSRQSRQEALA